MMLKPLSKYTVSLNMEIYWNDVSLVVANTNFQHFRSRTVSMITVVVFQ